MACEHGASRYQIVVTVASIVGFLLGVRTNRLVDCIRVYHFASEMQSPPADRIKRCGHDAAVVVGNSITLTPGTLTAEVNSNHLLVHAMDEESARDLVTLLMEQKVSGIFEKQEDQP